MRTQHVVPAALVLGLLTLACSSDTTTTKPETFTATLTGAGEVPPKTTNATGIATVVVNSNNTLDVTITYAGTFTSAITGGHIHAPAIATATTGIVLPFFTTLTPTSATLFAGTKASADLTGTLLGSPMDALVQLMRAGMAYVNVHTVTNGGGEIRGQLMLQP
jgi:hypothetical protein